MAGKGIPAAALMGELRGGLRAGVLAGGEPHETLRVLDRMTEHAGHMATVALVLLDPATGALRHASAGHLPPAVIAPGGAVRFLTAGASTPLLAYDAKPAPAATGSPRASASSSTPTASWSAAGSRSTRASADSPRPPPVRASWTGSPPTSWRRCSRRRTVCATTSRSSRSQRAH